MSFIWRAMAMALQAVAPQPQVQALKPGAQLSGEPGQAPVRIKGGIRDADYPLRLSVRRIQGDVKVQYTVGLHGRVSNCRIVESSHSAELDALTCRLIVKRFRFGPAKDGHGRDVVADIVETHRWVADPRAVRESVGARRH